MTKPQNCSVSWIPKKGIGLIERVKQGLGKPDRIYVRHFYTHIPTDENRFNECVKTAVSDAENKNSGMPEIRIPECGKSDSNYIDNTYTENNYTDQSISPADCEDTMEKVKEQVDYSILAEQYPNDDISCLVEIISEVLCSTQKDIVVGRERLPIAKVQARFRSLRFVHLGYVLDSMRNCTSKIRNIKNYLITALYNAPLTMDMYYSSAVRHDMYRGHE